MTERKPVIRLFFAKMKQDFIDLSEDDRAEFMRKDRDNLDALGMKAIAMIDCTQFGSEWDHIGVEEWPSVEAIEARERFETDELEISNFVEYRTYQGEPESFDDYGKA
jgi:hypothetical protein